jgi:hypothetical protein
MSALTASLLAYTEARKEHLAESAFFAELAESITFENDWAEAWQLFASEAFGASVELAPSEDSGN